MKKYLLLIPAIALIGAGCQTISTSETNSNTNTTNTVVNENVNVSANTNSVSDIDTSDWKTYTNNEYGFSFKYPDNLYLADKTNLQTTATKLLLNLGNSEDPNDVLMGISLEVTTLAESHDKLSSTQLNYPNQILISDEQTTNHSRVVTYENQTSSDRLVVTLLQNNNYVISLTCAEWSDKELCNQITDTLQF